MSGSLDGEAELAFELFGLHFRIQVCMQAVEHRPFLLLRLFLDRLQCLHPTALPRLVGLVHFVEQVPDVAVH